MQRVACFNVLPLDDLPKKLFHVMGRGGIEPPLQLNQSFEVTLCSLPTCFQRRYGATFFRPGNLNRNHQIIQKGYLAPYHVYMPDKFFQCHRSKWHLPLAQECQIGMNLRAFVEFKEPPLSLPFKSHLPQTIKVLHHPSYVLI